MSFHEIEIELEIEDGNEVYYPRMMLTVHYTPGTRDTWHEPGWGPEVEFKDVRVTFDSGLDWSDKDKVEKFALDYIASNSGRQYLVDVIEGYRI